MTILTQGRINHWVILICALISVNAFSDPSQKPIITPDESLQGQASNASDSNLAEDSSTKETDQTNAADSTTESSKATETESAPEQSLSQAKTKKPKQKWTLKELLSLTREKNGEIEEVQMDLAIAQQQLAQAQAAAYPRGTATLLGAPMFEETGNAITSTSNTSKWGPFLSASAQVVQPLLTFGQIDGYQKAAEKQIEATESLVKMKEAEVVLKAKELYYSYMMAGELEDLVEELVGFLEQATESAEKSLKKKKSTVKPHDVNNLKTNLADLQQKALLAKTGKKTAERAVAWISTSQFESLGKARLRPEKFEQKTLEEYLKLAAQHRPEFKALRAGQEARMALSEAKQAQSYPTLFVGGFVGFAWSPVVEDQRSIFANDPFNQFQGGAGIGLRFDLEYKRHAAEAAEEAAQAMKLKAKESYAVPGIKLEVKKAYWELEQAVKGMEIAKDRRRVGKKWFVGNAMGWSIGIVKARDLLESLEGNGNARRNYIETVFMLNMAIARMSQAVGVELAKSLQ